MALILIELDIYVVFFEGKSRNHFLVFVTYSNLLSSVFFSGKEEKRKPYTFTSRAVSSRPLTKVSANICVIKWQFATKAAIIEIYLSTFQQASGEC